MTPQKRNANIIGWTLIAIALLWIAPSVSAMTHVLVEASKQFWRDFQGTHGKPLLPEDRQPFPPKDRPQLTDFNQRR